MRRCPVFHKPARRDFVHMQPWAFGYLPAKSAYVACFAGEPLISRVHYRCNPQILSATLPFVPITPTATIV